MVHVLLWSSKVAQCRGGKLVREAVALEAPHVDNLGRQQLWMPVELWMSEMSTEAATKAQKVDKPRHRSSWGWINMEGPENLRVWRDFAPVPRLSTWLGWRSTADAIPEACQVRKLASDSTQIGLRNCEKLTRVEQFPAPRSDSSDSHRS